MNVVLVEPEIPPNTGNVARLCAATHTTLHLIEPLGFQMTDKHLKRAGMDYWQHVKWHKWGSWSEFAETVSAESRVWFVESNGPLRYDEPQFGANDYLVFGRETLGLPKQLLEKHPDKWLRIPMFNEHSRSLNLANCVSLVLFEALRQQGFQNELSP
jgi:tRNA (cytidine/uridine-2'-O-)-methyltransferase